MTSFVKDADIEGKLHYVSDGLFSEIGPRDKVCPFDPRGDRTSTGHGGRPEKCSAQGGLATA
jgi:hypothetical protein